MVWICGAAGSGKSTAVWGLLEELGAAGKRVAYVDIDQFGMLYPEPDDDPGRHHALKSEALATLVPGYVAGVRADERTLREHVRTRVGGSDARLAADDLLGADQQHQDAVVAAALAEQRVLDGSTSDDAVLDVSSRTSAAAVTEVERLVWCSSATSSGSARTPGRSCPSPSRRGDRAP